MQLLVSEKSNDDGFETALEAVLCEALDCQLIILVEQNFKEFYKNDALKNTVSIQVLEAIENLYHQPLKDIEISPLDEAQKNSLKRALDLANEIFVEERETQHLSFFKTKSQLLKAKEKTTLSKFTVSKECF